jgi:MFS family permease
VTGLSVKGADDRGARDALVAAITRSIFAAVALGMTAFYAVVTIGPLAAVEITGNEGLSGLPIALAVIGTAAGSTLLSNVMAARGRRAGLLLGLVTGIAGALIALVAMATGTFIALLAAMFLMGSGNAANQLARYAGADMHAVERRGSVISWIVWAGAIGAVMGPSLLPFFRPVARLFNLSGIAGGFLIAAIFFSVAVGVYLVAVRTDPSELAIASDIETRPGTSSAGSDSRPILLAVVALVASQSAMILVMTVTPIQVTHAHHGVGAVSLVIGAHLFGMFGLAPIAGRLVDRVGSVPIIALGGVLIIVACVMVGLMPASSGPMLAAPLFLLGLGWSLGFVAGSALLARGLAPARRAKLQGRIDTLVWSCSAGASLAAGVLIDALGYANLGLIGIALMVLPLALLVTFRREALAAT